MKYLLLTFILTKSLFAFELVSETAFEKYDEKLKKTVSFYPTLTSIEDYGPDLATALINQNEVSKKIKSIELIIKKKEADLVPEKDQVNNVINHYSVKNAKWLKVSAKKSWDFDLYEGKIRLQKIPFFKEFQAKDKKWITEVKYQILITTEDNKEIVLEKSIKSVPHL